MPNNNIVVQTTRYPITISTVGLQGPPGPQGPAGANSATSMSQLQDAIIINPQNNQFLKYVNGAWTNVNTQILDGGNF